MIPQSQPIAYVHLESDLTPPIMVGYDERWSGPGPLVPHRHAYHELLWFQSGSGLHTIDGQEITMLPNTVALIAQGQVHRFVWSHELSFYTICFTDDCFELHPSPTSQNYRRVLYDLPSTQTLAIPAAERPSATMLLQLMLTEYTRSQENGRDDMLRHLLRAFLSQVERIHRSTRRRRPATTLAQEQVYWTFLQLLEQHALEQHQVSFYATALNRSTEQLNGVLQRMLGKTTKQVIMERVMLEARRQLQFTTRTVKEVAFALGFSDPFHFSKLFKQYLGMAPQEYREQIQSSRR